MADQPRRQKGLELRGVERVIGDPAGNVTELGNQVLVLRHVGGNVGIVDFAHERFFVGLRLAAGVRPSGEEWERFAQPIRRFVDQGLLESADGMLRLTDRGVMLSNEVFQEFLPL